ncbi:hypothetical protein HK096_011115 [Nowakowskiella sp. JEL0078]|nr:hypothetical protein HK096_011115 [Nowakowskiella sp. JEL0078]
MQKISRLVVDFDLTLTIIESAPLMVNFADYSAAKRNSNHCKNQHRRSWAELSQEYRRVYPKSQSATCLVGYFEAASKVEQESYQRIGDSKIFRNFTRSELFEYGKRNITLHPFAKEVLEKFGSTGVNQIYILSLCWNKDFIDAALGGIVDRSKIWSNDLEFAKTDCGGEYTSGKIVGDIFTGLDKLSIFRERIKKIDFDGSLTVGVGDSLNDVPYLLECDVGILYLRSFKNRKSGNVLYDASNGGQDFAWREIANLLELDV